MNEQSPICLKCPAKRVCEEPQTMPDGITIRTQTCPPQDKAVRLYQKTKGAETSTTQTPNEQLSTIKQDVLGRYHCPNSEKILFIDLLEKRVNSRRNAYFNPNNGISSLTRTEIQEYTSEKFVRFPSKD